jgi:hypothetical protein
MARRNDLLQKRNADLKRKYLKLMEDNPKWRFSAIIEELEKEFYLSASRIERIINQ